MAVPQLRVADVDFNVKSIIETIRRAAQQDTRLLVFPEMAITGYSIGDLVQHQVLLQKARDGLSGVLQESAAHDLVVIVGMPLVVEQRIFNCAAVLYSGNIAGVVPKTHLPNYREFYEDRWFTSGRDSRSDTLELLGQAALFGTDILFKLRGIDAGVIGVEICEDLWMPLSPHEHQALSGATVLINLSASNEVLGKADWRRTMISSESGRCRAAYCYVSSGTGESSNDLVYGGHAVIAMSGRILRESTRLSMDPQFIFSDIDTERLARDRRSIAAFNDNLTQTGPYRIVEVGQGKDG
jgi:NAD+ synthase (glutamine-hydrolysing)